MPRKAPAIPRRLKTFGDIYEADTDDVGPGSSRQLGHSVGNNLMWSLVVAGKDWKRNRDKVWKEVQRSNCYAASVAMLGMLCAIAQNELVFRTYEPNSVTVSALKLCNTVCSMVAVYCVYRVHWVQILLSRLRDHIDRGLLLQTEVGFGDVLATSRNMLILETFVVGLHLPPGCTFEFGTTTLQNYVVYRAETLFCLWNTLRLYLLWRLVRDRALNSIPQLFTIAHYTEVRLGSSYVTKRLLKSWASIFYLATVWAGLILLFAYWFRSMENTACLIETTKDSHCQQHNARFWSLVGDEEFEKVNDLYMWNHIWLIFIVSTKGNNGAFRPTTHSSRFVAACASTCGIILTSFLTAALAQALTFNAQEDSTNLVIRRERARFDLKIHAVNMISRWYRVKTRRPLSTKQRGMLQSDMIKRLVEIRRQALGDLDDLLGPSDKIDKLNLRTKRMEFALYHLASEHNVETVTEFYANQEKEKTITAPQMPRQTDEDMDRHSVQETVVRMRRGSIATIRDSTALSPSRVASRSNSIDEGEASEARSLRTTVPDTADDSSYSCSRKRYLPGRAPKPVSGPPPQVDPALLAQIPAELLGLGGGPAPMEEQQDAVHPFRADAEVTSIEARTAETAPVKEHTPAQEPVARPSSPPPRFLASGDAKCPAQPISAPTSAPLAQASGTPPPAQSQQLLARLAELEQRLSALHSSQDLKMEGLERQLKALQQSQEASAAQILAALKALAPPPAPS